MLVRCSPLSPVVLTNILLALTSISHRTYLVTLFVGEVVTSLPYAYAAHIGSVLAAPGERGRDPVMIAGSFIGLAASIAVAWKVGVIAKSPPRLWHLPNVAAPTRAWAA